MVKAKAKNPVTNLCFFLIVICILGYSNDTTE
jgi:hypothetical protein